MNHLDRERVIEAWAKLSSVVPILDRIPQLRPDNAKHTFQTIRDAHHLLQEVVDHLHATSFDPDDSVG